MSSVPVPNKDEFGFIEVKVSDTSLQPQSPDSSTNQKRHHETFSQLTLEQLQQLCKQEQENIHKKQLEDAIWEDNTDEKRLEEKQIATEILKNLDHDNDVKEDEHSKAASVPMENILKRKVNEMADEMVGKQFQQFDMLPDPTNMMMSVEDDSGDKKKELLPSWFHNLDPDVQKEFLEAMNRGK